MPKSRSRKPKRARKRRPQQPSTRRIPGNETRGFFSTILSLWKIFLVVFALLSGTAGLYSVLLPRISASPSDSLNLSTPFETIFQIRNDGYFTIRKIQINCGIVNLAMPFGGGIKNIGFVFPDSFAEKIEPGGVKSLRCRILSMPSFSGTNIDMELIVSFRADYSPISTERRFRFVTSEDASGILHWLQQPAKSN